MSNRNRIAILIFFAWIFNTGTANSQINTEGDCNVIVVGNGNNVTVKCDLGEASGDDEHLLLVTRDERPPAIIRYLNPNFVDVDSSYYRLRINGKTIINAAFSEAFDDVDMNLAEGDYPYRMSILIRYLNGYSSMAHCSGIIRLRASASLIPRFLLRANESGRIFPSSCRFELKTD
ncbi:hypothetical protein [Rhizobium leguminosarum]|uniref:Uncharacterized protein n=1 Tax=Rhizobium leguminosarum TaxID=384 RepID=A0A7K3VMT4_RHILE|nr:hypothetical protein [Rhizobium leguminosarum]NEK17471.1 hypothetical protein [Rhizobium leguminosarum]